MKTIHVLTAITDIVSTPAWWPVAAQGAVLTFGSSLRGG